jgi:hypothetical protein
MNRFNFVGRAAAAAAAVIAAPLARVAGPLTSPAAVEAETVLDYEMTGPAIGSAQAWIRFANGAMFRGDLTDEARLLDLPPSWFTAGPIYLENAATISTATVGRAFLDVPENLATVVRVLTNELTRMEWLAS